MFHFLEHVFDTYVDQPPGNFINTIPLHSIFIQKPRGFSTLFVLKTHNLAIVPKIKACSLQIKHIWIYQLIASAAVIKMHFQKLSILDLKSYFDW